MAKKDLNNFNFFFFICNTFFAARLNILALSNILICSVFKMKFKILDSTQLCFDGKKNNSGMCATGYENCFIETGRCKIDAISLTV